MDPVTAFTATVDHDPDGTPVVVLSGQLDLTTAKSAEHAFATLVATGPDGRPPVVDGVVVDMTELTFMDSTGLTVLLMAVNRGHTVQLRRPTTLVRRLIDATGLGEILPVEP